MSKDDAFDAGTSDPASFLSGSNAAYVEHLQALYVQDPSSVDESWRVLFDGMGTR